MTIQMYCKNSLTGKKEPTAVIGAKTITFNRSACEIYLKSSTHAEIGYDPDTQQVVIFLKKAKAENTLTFNRHKEFCRILTIQGFMKQFKLSDHAGRVCSIEARKDKALGEFLVLTPGEKRRPRKVSPKVRPPAPASPCLTQPGLPGRPASGKTEYQCTGCGYSHPAWKYGPYKDKGHPDQCPKCNGLTFEPISSPKL